MQSQNRSLGGFPSLGDLCMFFTLGNRCTFSCSGHRNPNTYGASSSEYYDLEGWFPRRLATSLFPQVLKTVIRKLLLKGHSQFWDRADLETSLLTLKKSSPQPEIKVHQEIRFNFCTVLLDFQSFTEKPAFECPFTHPMILFLTYLVKNSIFRVSVICKVIMKWYLMRMCTSSLYPCIPLTSYKEYTSAHVIPMQIVDGSR